MNIEDTSDVLDMTKENIRPLKHGRKPVQLETALQAQNSVQIQKQLNKEKETYENAIRTYEGDDPLGPRFEYIKWLEQMCFKSGPESCILNVLIEETVQKFKNNTKYKQDVRFVEILINFIENQPNTVELYQTVYNQGIGQKCALFYRAWADLLDRHNDFKRVDQIYQLGIQANAEPFEELEQAHLQFQLSIARRMLNGQLSKEENQESDEQRKALGVLRKSEARSGVRHGVGHSVGKLLQTNNVNGAVPTIKVFEDNGENKVHGIATSDCDLAPKGLNKENTVKPGPWTKPKKSHHKVYTPVSTVNFEVHEDNAVEPVTKLNGVKVPNALRSRKGSTSLSCPIAVFEAPDPTKMVMYCKDKVYAAGRDIQLEEIRAEMYFKQEKDSALSRDKTCTLPDQNAEPIKKVISSDDNSNTGSFKIPSQTRSESDPLSQSVTVNTKVAIDLVQQMWNSPTDKPQELKSKTKKQEAFDEFQKSKNTQISSDFAVYEDNKTPIKNEIVDQDNRINQKEAHTKIADFDVYSDENNQPIICQTQIKNKTADKGFQINSKEAQKKIADFDVYSDENNQPTICQVPDVYIDYEKMKTINYKTPAQNKTIVNNQAEKSNKFDENKSPFNKISRTDDNDDLTCTTKAFAACLLSSSTPLAFGGSKSRSVTGNPPQSFKPPIIVEKENKESDDFQLGKSLSMILEASKERNSSASSGVISVSSSLKTEQKSNIDFGDNINPFDDELTTKLLEKVVKFPNKQHLSGYVEVESDVPNMRSEFKLGNDKMVFLGTIGKGAYGRVVKVRFDDKTGVEKALKIQKPPCAWEWYISKEIIHRLQDPEKILYFINMDSVHIFKNGSIISMDFCPYGTLLSVIQNYKKKMNRQIPTPIAAFLTLQVSSALQYLHQCQIIHGDLKPDNVILKSLPNQSLQPCVQLIDFGRSIDMTLYPPDTVFTYAVKTADFICHEMREQLPWTYQTDFFGLAGIMYTLLMSDYLQTQKLRKIWVATKPLPRYIEKDPWGIILASLLNIQSCTDLPNLDEIINKLSVYYSKQQKAVVTHHFISLKNVLTNN